MEEQDFNINIEQKSKPNWTVIILTIASLLMGWLLYDVFSNKSEKYDQYQNKIDSLTKEVSRLDSMHVKQDSVIVVYKDSIVYMDNIIEKEKIKFIDIKKKYNEARTTIANYSNPQLDSFFSNRYRY